MGPWRGDPHTCEFAHGSPPHATQSLSIVHGELCLGSNIKPNPRHRSAHAVSFGSAIDAAFEQCTGRCVLGIARVLDENRTSMPDAPARSMGQGLQFQTGDIIHGGLFHLT